MTETRKQIIELIYPYMDKTPSRGVYIELDGELTQSERTYLYGPDNLYEKAKIIGHYDITAVFDYIDSINLGGIGPYYFDSVNFSKDYYILTPTGDNDYARIPRKPLHLYTEQEDKELLELLQGLI